MASKINCDELYKKTQQKPWSHTIKTRKRKWLGYLLRLPEGAPAKKVLEIYLNYPSKHLRTYAYMTINQCMNLATR